MEQEQLNGILYKAEFEDLPKSQTKNMNSIPNKLFEGQTKQEHRKIIKNKKKLEFGNCTDCLVGGSMRQCSQKFKKKNFRNSKTKN